MVEQVVSGTQEHLVTSTHVSVPNANVVPSLIQTDEPVAVVNVKSSFFSKINWTQAIQALAAVLVIATGGKINIDPQSQLLLVGGIVVVGNLITVIIKTYFTPTVTAQSIAVATKPTD